MRDELSELLEVLNDRERTIIFERFGLDDGKPKTLEEVGKKFGVTRERIRQLQNIALAKLRRALAKREKPKFNCRAALRSQTAPVYHTSGRSHQAASRRIPGFQIVCGPLQRRVGLMGSRLG
jgi:hypothetical protein